MIDRAAIKSAGRGFLIFALMLGLACLLLILCAYPFAEATARVPSHFGWSREEDKELIIQRFHYRAGNFALLLMPFFGIYWVICGLLGAGAVAMVRWANIVLALVVAISLGWTLNSIFHWIDTYCDQLFVFTEQESFFAPITQCPGSQRFAYWSSIAMLPLALISLIVRILISRRAVN